MTGNPNSHPFIVFVDANVIYSRTLRDWLFMLRAQTSGDIFTLASSWDVLAEAASRLRDSYPAASGQLVSQLVEKSSDYMDELVTDYPGGPVAWLKDEGDWHVHHAATVCRARYLLAEDRGFSSEHSSYEAITCDEFFLLMYQLDTSAVHEVAQLQNTYWSKRAEPQNLSQALRRANCQQFAELLEDLTLEDLDK